MPNVRERLRDERLRQLNGATHHTFAMDLIIELVMFSSAIMFVVGSFCFFSGVPTAVLEAGEILFIVASVAYVTVGAFEMWELITAHNGLVGNSSFHEQMAYFCAAIIFMLGTVLYWPHIYRGHEEAEKIGEEMAAWCFIVGSLGFVIAAFWNAVSMSQPSHHQAQAEVGKKRYWLTVWALFCSLMGGVFFVTGSYLFRLNFKTKCKEWVPDEMVPGDQPTWCVGITDQGTILFIIGSIFYLIQSSLNMWKLCLSIPSKQVATYAPVPDGSDSEEAQATLARGEETPDDDSPASTHRWC